MLPLTLCFPSLISHYASPHTGAPAPGSTPPVLRLSQQLEGRLRLDAASERQAGARVLCLVDRAFLRRVSAHVGTEVVDSLMTQPPPEIESF